MLSTHRFILSCLLVFEHIWRVYLVLDVCLCVCWFVCVFVVRPCLWLLSDIMNGNGDNAISANFVMSAAL
jgi:hypothetical protein